MTPPRIYPEEWDRYKEVILELFPKLRCAQLLEHLNSVYGFSPTEAQWERQREKWGLKKNNTKKEWQCIAGIVEKRKLDNKESNIIAHSNIVPSKKLKRARKWIWKSNSASSKPEYTSDEAPAGIIISTPPAAMDSYIDSNLTNPFSHFETILELYVNQYHKNVPTKDAFVEGSPRCQIELDYLLKSLCNFGFNSPLQMAGIDFAEYEESLQWQENQTLHREFNDLIKGYSGESLNMKNLQCDDNPTATSQKSIDQAADKGQRRALQSFTPANLKQAFQLLRYAIYLSTNNLLSILQTDGLLRWVLDSGNISVIELVLAQRSPTTDTFASKLLISSIRLRETTVSQKLLESGVNPNVVGHTEHDSTSPIYEAISKGDSVAVRLLMKHGADADPWIDGRQSPLTICIDTMSIGENRTEIIRALIENGADIDEIVPNDSSSSCEEWTVFHEIIESGDVEAAKLFLNAGTSVNSHKWEYPTPLQVAVLFGHSEMVELLLHFGADINAPICQVKFHDGVTERPLDEDEVYLYLTPLQIAIANDRFEVVEILLERGADVNGYDVRAHLRESDYERYTLALQNNGVWSSFIHDDVFIEREDDHGIVSPQGLSRMNMRDSRLASSPLQAAAASGNTALARRLLNLGANIHAVGCFGTTLQIAASKEGQSQFVKLLLNRGANVNSPAYPPVGRTALQAAIECGEMETVDLLIDAGADINAAPSGIHGRTALQAAIETGNVKLAARLIQLKANVHTGEFYVSRQIDFKLLDNIKNITMIDLLQLDADIRRQLLAHYSEAVAVKAAKTGQNLQDLQKLLKHGIDANKLGSFLDKQKLLYDTKSLWQRKVLQLLLEYDMNPNLESESSSPIVQAIMQKNTKSVQLLIKYGAEVNALISHPDRQPKTLMEIAAATGSIQLCQTLITAKVDLEGNMGTAALASAVDGGHLDVTKLFLSLRVSPNWQAETQPKECFLNDFRPLISRVLESLEHLTMPWDETELKKSQRLIEFLMDYGAVVERSFTNLKCLRFLSATLVQRLFRLDLGAGSHLPSSRSMCLLQVAAREGNMAIAQDLLHEDSEVKCPLDSEGGNIALQSAAKGQHRDMVEFLLSKGADANGHDEDYFATTALMKAILVGSMPIFILLLKNGADVNATGTQHYRQTALQIAAERGRLSMVYMLLARDREPDTLEVRCKSAAMTAENMGFPALAGLLREWKKSKEPTSGDGIDDPYAAESTTGGDYVSPSAVLLY